MHKHNLIEEIKNLGIKHITADSRAVEPGSAFFAINENYIEEALQKGARLIIAESNDYNLFCDFLVITVPDVRVALAEAAEFLYPEIPDYLIAVTGTSGKTSIVNYFMQICEQIGYKAASIGSLGVKCTDKYLEKELIRKDELNTPDIVTMRKILSSLKKGDINYVAFEASSHGIDQKRIHGIKVDAAAFTNLTHDHLDYHKTMEAYLQAKMKLFSENMKPGGSVIINNELKKYFLNNKSNIVTLGEEGDIKIVSTKQYSGGQEIRFTYLEKDYIFSSNIIGSFQAENLLMATILADKVLGNFGNIVDILPNIRGVRGRLERATPANHTYQVFIDYSHKPAALESALNELKAITRGRLIVVFGCGGDRDREKRPIMGEVAAKIADIVIITDDNPRSEDASLIRKEIIAKVAQAVEISSREEAIKAAIKDARIGDIVLIAGKGHETYQIIGNSKLPFDDFEIAKKYIGTK